LLRLASSVLMDPFQPFERLHHLSRAAPAKVAALRTPRAAKRLRSEGTDNALRRTWSALRSIQVVVCLVVNVIEAPVHPRHPPPPRGALQVGARPQSETFLEKLEASPPPKLSFSSSLFWILGAEREREREGRAKTGAR